MSLRTVIVENVMEEYPSTHIFTIQSAFKYDYSPDEVKQGTRKIRERKAGLPHELDEQKCLETISKNSREYRKQIAELAPVINKIARFVPSRRKRKLHTVVRGRS